MRGVRIVFEVPNQPFNLVNYLAILLKMVLCLSQVVFANVTLDSAKVRAAAWTICSSLGSVKASIVRDFSLLLRRPPAIQDFLTTPSFLFPEQLAR